MEFQPQNVKKNLSSNCYVHQKPSGFSTGVQRAEGGGWRQEVWTCIKLNAFRKITWESWQYHHVGSQGASQKPGGTNRQTDTNTSLVACLYIYTHITRAFQTLHHRCIYKAAFIAKKTLLANCIQPNQSQCRPCRLVSKPSKLAQHLNNSCMLIIFVFLGFTSSKDHTA